MIPAEHNHKFVLSCSDLGLFTATGGGGGGCVGLFKLRGEGGVCNRLLTGLLLSTILPENKVTLKYLIHQKLMKHQVYHYTGCF